MRSFASKWKTIAFAAALVGALLAGLAGCSGNNNQAVGRLQLTLADVPSDQFNAVYVTVMEVRVHFSEDPAGDYSTVASPGKTYDLLSLVNGFREDLGVVDLIAGHYSQVRLILGTQADNSLNILDQAHPYANYVIDTANQYHELTVPTVMQQSGFTVDQGFYITEDVTTEVVLDIDGVRSVVLPGTEGNYLLAPSVRVVDLSSAATIEGNVRLASDQTPVAGAVVSAQYFNAQAADEKDQVVIAGATLSDVAGGYKIYAGGGTYNLVALKQGYAVAADMQNVPDVSTFTEDFSLTPSPGGVLTGTVLIGSAASDDYATISVRQTVVLDTFDTTIEVAAENIAAGGTYSFVLPPGSYTIVASVAGRTTQAADVVVGAGGTVTYDISF